MPIKRVSEKDMVISGAVPARHKPATTKRVKRTSVEAPVTQALPNQPSQEKIACLAYSYWEARGCQGGSPEEDWLSAVTELLAPAALAWPPLNDTFAVRQADGPVS